MQKRKKIKQNRKTKWATGGIIQILPHFYRVQKAPSIWVVIRMITLDWAPDGHYPLESLQLTSIATLFFWFLLFLFAVSITDLSNISLHLLEPMAEDHYDRWDVPNGLWVHNIPEFTKKWRSFMRQLLVFYWPWWITESTTLVI